MIEAWMRGYLKARSSSDRADMVALFTDDACRFTAPYAEPWVGAVAIASEWTVRCAPKVPDLPRHTTDPQTHHNPRVVRFAPDGSAREFTAWWMEEG